MEQPNQPTEFIRQCLTRYATGRGLSLLDAEDIVQETLLNYFESRQRWYEEDADPQPALLWKILRRRVVDQIRHRIAEKQAITLYTHRYPLLCPGEEDILELLSARQVMDSLPLFWQQVVNLRAEGWTWNEIASECKMSIGTLTKQWERILQRSFKILGIECRERGRSSDKIDECSIAQCEEVNEDETTTHSGLFSTHADVAEPHRFSTNPQRPDKCSGGGNWDFLRVMSPVNCGCSSQKQLSPREILSQLAVHHEQMKRQATQVAGPVMLSTVPCPADCGDGTAYAETYCLDEPANCGSVFQKHWWWIRWITYWNCPGANYYHCGEWMRDPEDSCCMWANGEVLPAECTPPGASYKECTLIVPP